MTNREYTNKLRESFCNKWLLMDHGFMPVDAIKDLDDLLNAVRNEYDTDIKTSTLDIML